MKILCVICHDLLIPSEDIFFTRCGHVFHHRCLLQWLERSKTCPQCRDEATADRIHKAHFTVSNTEIAPDNVDNSTLQGKIDSLQFQILLNERNINHYTSKNVILKKQNAGLRQEVRKVESEINQRNSAIYALKEQINNFQQKYREYEILKEKLSQKEKEMEEFLTSMYRITPMSRMEDIKKFEKTLSPNSVVNRISVMKKIISKKTKQIENFQRKLTRHKKYLDEEFSNDLKLEILKRQVTFCEIVSLQQRINNLEKLLETSSDQNYVTKSNSRRNSDENSLIKASTVNCYTEQINTKQETADQNNSFTLEEVEIITDANQENSNFTLDKYSTVTKKAKLYLQSNNSESDNSS